MLDLILIQDSESGLVLFEHKGKNLLDDENHKDIISGFLSAVQKVFHELNFGKLTQISTEDHHCVFFHNHPINVVVIVDCEDSIEYWREKARIISSEFILRYGENYHIHNSSFFCQFSTPLRELLSLQEIN